MARVFWTPVAESDLDDILFYIAFVDRRPLTGERLFYELRDQILDHAEFKRPGQVHPHAPENWLYLKHKRWLIFYVPLPDGIEIMRVIDGVRDLPRRLQEP